MTATANEAQLSYLETLWTERSDEAFPRDKFYGRTSAQVSALIDRVKTRPSLPPTEQQLDEIASLCADLGFENRPIENRKHANAKLYKLRRAVRARAYHAGLEAADKELDELLTAPF